MRVISASRRTDIPAFYTPWLLARIAEGHCHVVNPRSGLVSRVSLRAEDVLALGFFTRNPLPLLPHLPRLRDHGYRAYLHMTVNGYPAKVEPRSPALTRAIAAFREASKALGAGFTLWRYDPIMLSPDFDEAYHRNRFRAIAEELAGFTTACVLSYIDPYAKTRRNLTTSVDWTAGERLIALATDMVTIAAEYDIRLQACGEPQLQVAGVAAGACVDPLLISKLRSDVAPRLRLASTRPGCLCHEALDIGAYHTCAFGCSYCYATETPKLGLANRRHHDPGDSILFRPASLIGVDLDEAASVARTDEDAPDQVGGVSQLPLL